MFAEYCEKYPEMKEAWDAEFNMDIAKDLIDNEEFWAYEEKADATRNLSTIILLFCHNPCSSLSESYKTHSRL